ncbi:hypothetical protein [Ensifer sp. B1-9]|uniref:hypothetical protein n=1 Tax=Ensifer sp. B1-9 TaxID=3141455 RepID=UPI003D23E7D1
MSRRENASSQDWRIDGEHVFSVPCSHDEFYGDAAAIEFPDIPRPVSYVEFEGALALSLASTGARIEGCYMREIVCGGSLPWNSLSSATSGWKTMGSCTYSDAMAVGARTCFGIVPLGEETTVASIIQAFEGDPELTRSPAFQHAMTAVAAFSASASWRSRPRAVKEAQAGPR